MRSAMRYVREEDGMELIKNGAAVLYKPTAAVNGFVREGDVPSSLTELLSMAMKPNAFQIANSH
jgi:hypothetical protein